jgi:hypothetical protein
MHQVPRNCGPSRGAQKVDFPRPNAVAIQAIHATRFNPFSQHRERKTVMTVTA